MPLLRVLTHYLRRYPLLLIAVLLLQLLQALGTLTLPTLNANIINEGVARADIGYIWRTGGVMLLVAAGQVLAAVLATLLASMAAMRLGRDLRSDIFDRVSDFSEREISAFGAGSLITRNTNDVQQVQMLAQMGMTLLLTAPMLAIGGIIMALRQDVGLSWLIWVAVPLLGLVVGAIVARMIPLFQRFQEKLDGINRILREQLTGIRVVRAFVREDIERDRFAVANRDITRVGKAVGDLFVLVFPLAMLIMDITVVGVIWFGGIEVDAGNVEIGTLFAYMAYVMQVLMGVIMVSFITTMIPRAAVCAERADAVLATPSTLVPPAHGVSEFPRPGEVVFDRVGFTYPGADAPVLNDISFTAPRGETVAIIGSTGAGKTTLVGLIPRLFDATSGAVRVGGVDVREAVPDALWRRIGLVPQRPYLFGGTIRSNLLFGREDASEAELWEALEIAQAAEFVREKDHGLDEPISQGGTNVSGGQRQRLSIARALLHRPDVLVFDDSFSALDVATDARLRQALWEQLPDITKIVVAQRVSTITGADRIIVLDHGRVVGDGAHADLLESNRVYREIVDSQLGVEAAR